MRVLLHASRRPRHPLARALSVVVSLAMVGILMLFGLFVASVLLVGGLILLAVRQWKSGTLSGRSHRARARPDDALEGEFVVLSRQQHKVH